MAVSETSWQMWFGTMSRSAPALLVVAAALLDADRFRHRDLHVVDVAAVPDRLEDAVGEAEDQDVLDGLFAQVVIDAVDLVSRRSTLRDLAVERLRADSSRCRMAFR